jgi:hypothetical protein
MMIGAPVINFGCAGTPEIRQSKAATLYLVRSGECFIPFTAESPARKIAILPRLGAHMRL